MTQVTITLRPRLMRMDGNIVEGFPHKGKAACFDIWAVHYFSFHSSTPNTTLV